MSKKIALLPKTMLKDRYQIKTILGENGLSISYLAYDTFREKQCVIKELFPEMIVSRALADKMSVEVKQLSNEELFKQMAEHMIRQAKVLIKHFPLEGIANVITYFEENNTVYVVNEYIEGTPLSVYLNHRKNDRFALAAILNFFSPMTDSLIKLHKENVFHGKVRPNQIIITKKNGIKLIGFCDPMQDIVKQPLLEEMIQARDNRYSSVELFMEEGKLGSYTDVYGLAATVYHCITRNEPMDFYNRIGKRDKMPSPLELDTPISKKQNEAIMKGLAPHDFERYQTIEELLAEIRAGAQADEFEEAEPIILYQPPFAFLQKQKNKRRIAAACAVLAVVFLCIFIPKTGAFISNVRVRSFYNKLINGSLYEQCETLKWLGKKDRKAFTNDYTQIENEKKFTGVYYDALKRELVGREEFVKKGLLYEFVEINYRENGQVVVIFYDREETKTLMINLNNLGEAYQVTESVEKLGKKAVTRSFEVDENTDES